MDGWSAQFVRNMNERHDWSSEGLLEALAELDPIVGKGACSAFVEGCSAEGSIIHFEADEEHVRVVTYRDAFGYSDEPREWEAPTAEIEFAYNHGGLMLRAPGPGYLCLGVECYERMTADKPPA